MILDKRKGWVISLLLPAMLFGTIVHAQKGSRWQLKKKDSGVEIYTRAKKGSEVNEVLGKTKLQVPNWVLMNVISDFGNYKDFMPYTLQSYIVKNEGNTVYSYQFLNIPLISNRDYVIAVTNNSYKDKNGNFIYKAQWVPGNQLGPALPEDTVRVEINDGYWLFESTDNGRATLVSYYLYTSPGGSIPDWIANRGNTRTIPDMFEAIKKQSQKKIYWQTKPKLAR